MCLGGGGGGGGAERVKGERKLCLDQNKTNDKTLLVTDRS